MAKILFAIFLVIVVIAVDSALLSFPIKNSDGKLKISIEYVNGNVQDDCTEECKLSCNDTCGPNTDCREMCYVYKCHCPPKNSEASTFERNYNVNENQKSSIPLRFYPQQIQCSPMCINKCFNLCDNKNFNCKEYCQIQCCPYSFSP